MPLDTLTQLAETEPGRTCRSKAANALGRWWPALGRALAPKPVTETAAFSSAVIALAAKMAKADGVAVKVECQTFERYFDPAPNEVARIRRLYHLASQDIAGYEIYAQRIARMLKDEADLKISVLECLLMIACADGVLHPAEDAFLRTVGDIFGITGDRYLRIRSRFVRDIECPYAVLGIEPSATPAEVRARYLALVHRFHPDRLIAVGAQAPLIKAATVKLAAINAAYEAIVERSRPRGAELAQGEPA
jgi:DnaJ like chaperone protein